MSIRLRITLILALVVILLFFIMLIRKRKLDLKYSLLWLICSVLAIIAIAFPQVMSFMTDLMGMQLPVNMVFFISIAFLTAVCISLTVTVSRLNERIKKLTQQISIMDKENRKS